MSPPSNNWQAQVSALLGSEEQASELRKRFRDDLSGARAKVTADAEGFEVVVHAIERLGRHLKPDGTSLGDYEGPLLDLVKEAVGRTTDLEEQLFLLRQTRNDHAHQGHVARNAAREAVRVAIRLEDALNIGWANIKLKHVMVTDVVTTRPGDTLNDVRRMLQEHAFTAIPARISDGWYLITDRWLALQLAGRPRAARDAVLATAVEAVFAMSPTPETAQVLPMETSLSALGGALGHALILVASDPAAERLEGVVSPSDLL